MTNNFGQFSSSSLLPDDLDNLGKYKITRRGVYLSVLASFLLYIFFVSTEVAQYNFDTSLLIGWIILIGLLVFPATLFAISLIERKFEENGAMTAAICTLNAFLYIFGEGLAKLNYNHAVLIGSGVLTIFSWAAYLWRKKAKSKRPL
ncbi:MAG: hypothetical protein COV85_01590 [Candidatus Portnoybacteria bacterium CG11_big_fil_rev_8_21_14_0_20_44_10]|uniref:Uncharacterized protein n=1 Tax=Candidatus Portnoybacteria bacterium CG11_big_fil_rev_8_21_14_0_20_44_10 TaxID=1974818 RepID=A0A2H0KQV9_9BACT|nr:MAG: hypothetical protein AUK17_02060 [Parcubacteria group bacterium CG2_30_44_18]PIQ74532.1 MAG: hypothetical protein COV85_01590 [Candidatus Portnoybacteria bacterium CG11_big_fil_rev_8_21_14_0_20_44_10]